MEGDGLVTGETQAAYERGVLDGRVAVRLDQHDAQLAATNNVLARTVEITHTLTLAVQSLDEGAIAREKAAASRAAALKDEKDAAAAALLAESRKKEQMSIPWARAIGIASVLVMVLGVLVTLAIYIISQ